MIECVVNVSEGRDQGLIQRITGGVPGRINPDVLDVHSDADHNRSVLTLVGTSSVRDVTRRAVELLDIRTHAGAHPRLGVVDVVPFIALEGSTNDEARSARDDYGRWISEELCVPVFFYGPERTLPEIRRSAWKTLLPDLGPHDPHPSAGAVCVGVRSPLIAYNVALDANDMVAGRAIATEVRRPGIRTLAFLVGGRVQISMNIVETNDVSVSDAYDAVDEAARARGLAVDRAELVGLISEHQLRMNDHSRWARLDLGLEKTIEFRLSHRRI